MLITVPAISLWLILNLFLSLNYFLSFCIKNKCLFTKNDLQKNALIPGKATVGQLLIIKKNNLIKNNKKIVQVRTTNKIPKIGPVKICFWKMSSNCHWERRKKSNINPAVLYTFIHQGNESLGIPSAVSAGGR